MSPPSDPRNSGVSSFRTKLLVAMMVVVLAVAAVGLSFAQNLVASNVRRDFQREFQGELAALHALQEVRDAALAERCRALARRPRIHAALEDGAPDLLYPSARDELQDVMVGDEGPYGDQAAYSLHARYYRFLDAKGGVISPPDAKDVGELAPPEESQLALARLTERTQTGYLLRAAGTSQETVDEVIAMPIVSTENGDVISAIVLGFKAPEAPVPAGAGIRSGIWLNGRLVLPGIGGAALEGLTGEVARAVAAGPGEGSLEASAGGDPYLLFYKRLNPGSLFPPAFEVSIFPLASSVERQRRLLWQFGGAGALLVLGALVASHLLSRRLSMPVERLAVDSRENLTQRHRAEAALELTSQELQRAARFSADASHQLKTPVTVLRSGLEELLAGEAVSLEAREEVSALVHQTFRLASIIEDLLLLSRMDAGRLQIQFSRLDLTQLGAAWLDDLGALPDALHLRVDADFPPSLWISGEKRFATLIVQNLLENASKYNQAGGRIRIAAREEGEWAVLSIGNTGGPIPASAQEHIFERFHRGAMGENVPGHGIGLSLARELARLHGGDLRLARSDEEWTEFEVRFRLASAAAGTPGSA
ncbi:MAG TPA: HAMP domain-containing sensor histidine kinase [Opitutaceae bacterium]